MNRLREAQESHRRALVVHHFNERRVARAERELAAALVAAAKSETDLETARAEEREAQQEEQA